MEVDVTASRHGRTSSMHDQICVPGGLESGSQFRVTSTPYKEWLSCM